MVLLMHVVVLKVVLVVQVLLAIVDTVSGSFRKGSTGPRSSGSETSK